ncbi:MAG: peptidoglycan/xylan/chitin deacetylase (PgdA/CDA1 family) [Verrucomicrobiales bacterium]|jgi:peptidoglycan/xylan/chitin deacetylase (PgdA/CDA1 family)
MKVRVSFSPLLFALASVFACAPLSSCDKARELSKQLEAPEEAPPELSGAPVEIPQGPDYVPPELDPANAIPTEPPPPKFNAEAQVSILGYHDFTETSSPTDMRIRVEKFRQQMQALKDNEIPVITMRDYLDWKKGEKMIPEKCVVITMDDGWVGVYNLAFPVLKEFGYPFSIYLYKEYVNRGGRSMTYEQIREMMANGCEVGSHSVSHDFMARTKGRSAEQHEAWLREELGESLRFLREHFGEDVLPVFVYPYGNYNDQVLELAEEYGYELGLTVAPKKADHTLDDLKVGRYIIHGDNNINITVAMKYRGQESLNTMPASVTGTSGSGEEGEPTILLSPKSGEVIATRTPRIEANISKLKGVSSSNMTMRVSGLGRVPFDYDSDSGIISYQLPERIRQPGCSVSIYLTQNGKQEQISWSFKINRTALYLPQETVKATPIAPPAAATDDAPTEDPEKSEAPSA